MSPQVSSGASSPSVGSRSMAAHKSCEGRIDLTASAGVEHLDLQPHGAGSRCHVSQRSLAGLTSTAIRAAPGTISRRNSSRFVVNYQ